MQQAGQAGGEAALRSMFVLNKKAVLSQGTTARRGTLVQKAFT